MSYVGRFFNSKEEDREYINSLERDCCKVYYDLYDDVYVCHKIAHMERVTLPSTPLSELYKKTVAEYDTDKPKFYKYNRSNREQRFEDIKEILRKNIEKEKEFRRDFDDLTEKSIDEFIETKKKDNIGACRAKMKRFMRKAGMNRKIFNYFITITRDSEIFPDADNWMTTLKRWFANNSFRYGLKIMGGFEFGDENGRLHFHAVAHVPEDFFENGDLKKVSRYSERERKWRNVFESTELRCKFGINEFESISCSDYKSFLDTLTYVSCYASKDGGYMYYSRGLSDSFPSFVKAEDIFYEFDDGVVKYRLCDAWEKSIIGYLRRRAKEIYEDLPFDNVS